ncbi:unnamed protein product [Closterium sp. Naga37s-1]|nr:unnamed protein product [Closterium sp. Naga37s-1]
MAPDRLLSPKDLNHGHAGEGVDEEEENGEHRIPRCWATFLCKPSQQHRGAVPLPVCCPFAPFIACSLALLFGRAPSLSLPTSLPPLCSRIHRSYAPFSPSPAHPPGSPPGAWDRAHMAEIMPLGSHVSPCAMVQSAPARHPRSRIPHASSHACRAGAARTGSGGVRGNACAKETRGGRGEELQVERVRQPDAAPHTIMKIKQLA